MATIDEFQERLDNLLEEAKKHGLCLDRDDHFNYNFILKCASLSPVFTSAQAKRYLDSKDIPPYLLNISTKNNPRFPKWEFLENDILPGLEEVLSILEKHDNLSKIAFFYSWDITLPYQRTPATALRAGHLEAVKQSARRYLNHGAL